VPKYRHKILTGAVGNEVGNCIRAFSKQKEVEIVEMNIQPDHVHILALVLPKVSISDYCGIVKGRTAIRVFNKYRDLKDKRPIGAIISGPKATALTQSDWIQK
jgi:putative transposase